MNVCSPLLGKTQNEKKRKEKEGVKTFVKLQEMILNNVKIKIFGLAGQSRQSITARDFHGWMLSYTGVYIASGIYACPNSFNGSLSYCALHYTFHFISEKTSKDCLLDSSEKTMFPLELIQKYKRECFKREEKYHLNFIID